MALIKTDDVFSNYTRRIQPFPSFQQIAKASSHLEVKSRISTSVYFPIKHAKESAFNIDKTYSDHEI